MNAREIEVDGGWSFDLISIGVIVVLVAAGLYVAREARRGAAAGEPVGESLAKALRKVALPVISALTAIYASAFALAALAFTMVLAAFIGLLVSFGAGPDTLRDMFSDTFPKAVAIIFAMTVLALVALVVGGGSIGRALLRGRETKSDQDAAQPEEPAPPSASRPPSAEPEGARTEAATRETAREPLMLNEASIDELRALGLSLTQARRVIAARGAAGGFRSLDEFNQVPGLSAALRAELRAWAGASPPEDAF